MKWYFIIFGLLSCCYAQIFWDYIIVFDHEKIIQQCDEKPDNYITKVLDTTGLTFDYVNLGTPQEAITINGIAKFIYNLPNQTMTSRVEVKKNKAGSWVNTLFDFRKQNVCESLFDEAAVWYPYVKAILGTPDKCPPKQGDTYNVNVTVPYPIIRRFHSRQNGEYNLHSTITYGPNYEDYLCLDTPFTFTRYTGE